MRRHPGRDDRLTRSEHRTPQRRPVRPRADRHCAGDRRRGGRGPRRAHCAPGAGLDVALGLGAAGRTGLRRARPRGPGLRTHLARRAPAVAGPGPPAGRRLLRALRPRHRTLHDAAQCGQRRRGGRPRPLARSALDRRLAASGRRRRHVARHGPVQLARPPGRPPRRGVLAGACAPSFAGGIRASSPPSGPTR